MRCGDVATFWPEEVVPEQGGPAFAAGTVKERDSGVKYSEEPALMVQRARITCGDQELSYALNLKRNTNILGLAYDELPFVVEKVAFELWAFLANNRSDSLSNPFSKLLCLALKPHRRPCRSRFSREYSSARSWSSRSKS